jgi:hypothetical protein
LPDLVRGCDVIEHFDISLLDVAAPKDWPAVSSPSRKPFACGNAGWLLSR